MESPIPGTGITFEASNRVCATWHIGSLSIAAGRSPRAAPAHEGAGEADGTSAGRARA
jgi:hypothetical protein